LTIRAVHFPFGKAVPVYSANEEAFSALGGRLLNHMPSSVPKGNLSFSKLPRWDFAIDLISKAEFRQKRILQRSIRPLPASSQLIKLVVAGRHI